MNTSNEGIRIISFGDDRMKDMNLITIDGYDFSWSGIDGSRVLSFVGQGNLMIC